MRNHVKTDKEKKPHRSDGGSSSPSAGKSPSKTLRKSATNNNLLAKKLKDKSNTDRSAGGTKGESTAESPGEECIFLDAGSKKSYMDLTKSRTENEPYPRMSVIRSVLSQAQSTNYEDCQFGFYQEKPVDFSPKNKFKNECSTSANLIEISGHYATMVV